MPKTILRRPLRTITRAAEGGHKEVIVPPFAAGDRLDGFLVRHGEEPERTRSEWHRLIEAGLIRVNGNECKSGQRVRDGERVQIAPVAAHSALEAQSDVPFEVIYDDPAMIVINKPSGVVVHPAPGNEDGTLVNGLLARFPELKDITGEQRPGIVHRLDKDTSGLLVVGRTAAATADLQAQMQARTTEKHYLVLVRGKVNEDEGLIDAPIERDNRNRQRMAVREGGRESQTRFTVVERFERYTLVEVLLLTGRTHQIRVHFAHIGRPVAGDDTYGNPSKDPVKRQFVHSHRLKIRSPHDGEEREFVAELPADLADTLRKLRMDPVR